MRPLATFPTLFLTMLNLFQIAHGGSVYSAPIPDLNVIQNRMGEVLLNRSFTLRQQPNHSGVLHVQIDTNSYVCRIETGSLFPLPADLANVKIMKIGFSSETEVLLKRTSQAGKISDAGSGLPDITVENRFWKFSLKHDSLGRGNLIVMKENGDLPENPRDIIKVLGYVLKGADIPTPDLYVSSRSAKMVHYAASGHVHFSLDIVFFESEDQATAQGYKLCPLCFNELIRLPYLQTELWMGKQTEATIRHYYELYQSPKMQERVTRLGLQVLDNWPTKLKGYHYRFAVLDDQRLNAIACPGGYIFLNRGLVEAIEDDSELEAALAHEIAHVELRHGLMEYLKSQRNARNAAIFASIVMLGAGAAAATSGNRDAATIASAGGSISILLAGLAANLALEGYEKQHEQEADIYALIYLQNQRKSKEPLISILEKLRTDQEIQTSISGEKTTDPSHPDIKERLYAAETLQVHTFDRNFIFDAFEKDGDLLYTMTLHAQALYKKRDGQQRMIMLGEISTTPAIGDSREFEVLRLSGGDLRADTRIKISPFDTLAVSFSRTENRAKFFEGDFLPALDGISADHVVKRQTQN
jgi:Zn-dependent protease with chaperone function